MELVTPIFKEGGTVIMTHTPKTHSQGVYTDVTNEEYHFDPAISRSGIMMFAESPYKFWAHYINPDRPRKESTKAMDFGSAFHMYVLENEKFCEEYIIEPQLIKSPKRVLLKDVGRTVYDAYKAEKAKIDYLNEDHLERFAEQSEGKKIISLDDQLEMSNMYLALRNHPEAWALIQYAAYEQSYFWQDKESGLMLKARPDILHANMGVDLKTCVSAAYRAYQRVMVENGLHIQGAMIREGVRVVEGRGLAAFLNICIEKSYPHAIGIKIISDDALNEGHRRYKEVLMQMKQCFETNVWPSYEPETVELPAWA